MKTKLKITALVTAIVLALAGCNDKNEQKQSSQSSNNTETKTINGLPQMTSVKLETEKQKIGYSIGATFAEALKDTLKENEADNFDANIAALGFLETFTNKGQLSMQQIDDVLIAYNEKKQVEREAFVKQATERNITEGKQYVDQFSKQEGVKITDSGLLYKIENPGTGESPSIDDAVSINYIGKLINGSEFGNSYKDGKPLIMHLDEIVDGWQEGIMLLKEGGKATLVIPPNLAFGDAIMPKRREFTEVLPQSTLIVEIELIKVNPEEENMDGNEDNVSLSTSTEDDNQQAASPSTTESDQNSVEKPTSQSEEQK